MNPGDTTTSPSRCSASRSLNEGRGVNPGDTRKIAVLKAVIEDGCPPCGWIQ